MAVDILAASAHYPAIDVSSSISRLFSQLATPEQAQAAAKIRDALALLEESRVLAEQSADIHKLLRRYLGEDRASFGGLFDLPLLMMAEKADLRERLLRRQYPLDSHQGRLGFFSQLLSLVMSRQCVDEWIKRSIHYLIELMNGKADAVIGDTVFLEVIGANLF